MTGIPSSQPGRPSGGDVPKRKRGRPCKKRNEEFYDEIQLDAVISEAAFNDIFGED